MDCGESAYPSVTCTSQYRSTMRLKVTLGDSEFVAWEGNDAGDDATPQPTSPKKLRPSKTFVENKIMNRL